MFVVGAPATLKSGIIQEEQGERNGRKVDSSSTQILTLILPASQKTTENDEFDD
jgi:hypothetical protein